MHFTKTGIEGVWLIEPKVSGDKRGWFSETYREDLFAKHGIHERFVQDNHSCSERGVLRGLHYQIDPKAQAKLVRVTAGEAFDVVVDLRIGSRTFGQWHADILSADNHKMLYIPRGFAHGFLAMKDGTELVYKCTELYSPEHERGIHWSDATVNIAWPKIDGEYKLSDKDKKYPSLKQAFGLR